MLKYRVITRFHAGRDSAPTQASNEVKTLKEAEVLFSEWAGRSAVIVSRYAISRKPRYTVLQVWVDSRECWVDQVVIRAHRDDL